MDDLKQEISIFINRFSNWTDSRVTINKSHAVWYGINSSRIRLDSNFVEKCLWMPKLQYMFVKEMASWKLSPTNVKDSPIEVYLQADGVIIMISYNILLTVTCSMNFDAYPFDQQVR